MPLAKDVHATTASTVSATTSATSSTTPSADRSATRTVRRSMAASAEARSERTTPVGSERSVSPPAWEADAQTHLVRLCLDLQLDAMLLALGAASAGSRQDSVDAETAVSPPWRRWVQEDVEMICTLAADVMSGGAALPPTLGSDLDQAVPAAAVDNLMARYESMAALLADILPPSVAPARPSAPYRTHAQETLARCQQRLRELHGTRLEQTPPRGLPLPTPIEHPPVPGEWLG